MNNLPGIPKRFYSLVLALFLFVAMVILILLFVYSGIKKSHTMEQQLIIAKENTEKIYSLQQELILSYFYGESAGRDVFEHIGGEINNTLLNHREIVSTLRHYRLIKRNDETLRAFELYHKSVVDFSASYTALVTSVKERGNLMNGLVAGWIKQTQELQAIFKSNEDILSDLERIKGLQFNYLFTCNPALIDEISNLVLSIQGQLSTEESINSGSFDTLMQFTAEISSLNNRIGLTSAQGELLTNIQAYELTRATHENLVISFQKSLRHFSLRIILAGFLLIMALLMGFIVLLYLIFEKSSLLPLRNIRYYVGELSRGMIPHDPIRINPVYDPESIAAELNKLCEGLRIKTQVTRDLNEGRLDTKIELLSEHDELGHEIVKLQKYISSSVNEQKRYNEENTERRYINEGLAKFGNILRLSTSNLSRLGDMFIMELVKYLHAVQGGFFILEEKEKPLLILMAAFAYNRKKYLEKNILLGEGLVGTCAIEKKTINLTEIPREYISITSGLGDAPPENLLLVPVLHDEELIGVLELASLRKFKDFEITFAEEVAGNLGSTIITTRVNQRTADLLSKSQQQAIEMAEQEEEMRQNMEELKATQEESMRREEEFRGIVDALNQSIYIIEYELDGSIISVNNKFLNFLNRKEDEFIGKSHAYIFGAKTSVDSKFWDQLGQHTMITINEKFLLGKKTYLIKEHFVVVTNKDGLPLKVLNFLTEIPE